MCQKDGYYTRNIEKENNERKFGTSNGISSKIGFEALGTLTTQKSELDYI